MTTQPVPAPVQRRMSVASLLSLICGILGCIPFVPGLLAILLGIVGLIRTANPLRKGRWMAVVGLILGLVSVSVWTISGAAMIHAGYALYKGITAPAAATHDFIKALADNDMAAAKSHSQGISDDDLAALAAETRSHGAFIDSTMNNAEWNNGAVSVSGSARFTSGTQNVSAKLEKVDEQWKVTQLTIGGPEATTGP